MKKLFFVGLFLLLAGGVMAQSPLTIGPRFGLHYNKLSDTDPNVDIGYDYLRTWSGGLFVRANVGRVYLQPEAYFNTKGSNLHINRDPANPNTNQVDGQIRLSSLDVPLIIGYKIAEGRKKKSNLRIFGGPVATFILREDQNDLTLLDRGNYDFNKYNIGVQTGLGFDLGNLTFDARYETGLNYINPTFNQRTNVFLFSVGFKLF
jgi:hypothetical protein